MRRDRLSYIYPITTRPKPLPSVHHPPLFLYSKNYDTPAYDIWHPQL